MCLTRSLDMNYCITLTSRDSERTGGEDKLNTKQTEKERGPEKMTERDREKEEVSERESGRGERKERERLVISYCNLQ